MNDQEAREALRGVVVAGFNHHALGAGDADLSGYIADIILAAGYRKQPEPSELAAQERALDAIFGTRGTL